MKTVLARFILVSFLVISFIGQDMPPASAHPDIHTWTAECQEDGDDGIIQGLGGSGSHAEIGKQIGEDASACAQRGWQFAELSID